MEVVGIDNVVASGAVRKHSWRKFLRHFLEMLAAMIIGMFVGGAVFGGAASIGGVRYDQAIIRFPIPFMVVMAVGMTVPMVAWMRHRHHSWRATWEMAAVMIGLVVPFCVLLLAGVISEEQCGLYCALMIPAMLIVMLFRRAEYSQDHRHHQHMVATVSVNT